jgi:3-hydroxybutyryl-CoA dehydratase
LNLSPYHIEITESLHSAFIELSGDVHQLHTDEFYAKSKGFNGKVMHGNLLHCFLSYAIGVHLKIIDVLIINQSINYRNPYFIGDTLVLNLTVNSEIEFLPGLEIAFTFMRHSTKIADGKILIKTAL